MSDKEYHHIICILVKVLRDLDKWRGIAQMLTHLDTGCIVVDCKHCQQARITYMDANIEYHDVAAAADDVYKILKSKDN